MRSIKENGCLINPNYGGQPGKIVGWTVVPIVAGTVVMIAIVAKKVQNFNQKEDVYEAFIDTESA